MSNKTRHTSGKFVPKSELSHKFRLVNLTDGVWPWLATVVNKAGMSRNDYLEALAEGSNSKASEKTSLKALKTLLGIETH